MFFALSTFSKPALVRVKVRVDVDFPKLEVGFSHSNPSLWISVTIMVLTQLTRYLSGLKPVTTLSAANGIPRLVVPDG